MNKVTYKQRALCQRHFFGFSEMALSIGWNLEPEGPDVLTHNKSAFLTAQQEGTFDACQSSSLKTILTSCKATCV